MAFFQALSMLFLTKISKKGTDVPTQLSKPFLVTQSGFPTPGITHTTMKTTPLLRCMFVLVLTPLLAHSAAYLKFDGVDGESKDKDHKGWIDIDSMSYRAEGHKDWITIESFSQVIHRDIAARNVQTPRDATSGQATGKRERASGLSTGRRDAASGKSTGRREAASGLSTGKRDAASGLPTGKRQHKPIRVTKPIDKASPVLAKAMSNGSSIGNVTIQRVENGKTETLVLTNVMVANMQKARNSEHVTFTYEKIRQTANASVRGWDAKNKQAIQGRAKEKANRTK